MDVLQTCCQYLERYRYAVKWGERQGSSRAIIARRHFAVCLFHNWYLVSGHIIDVVFNDCDFRFYGELKEIIVKVARDSAIAYRQTLDKRSEWLQRSIQCSDTEFKRIWEERGRENAECKGLSDFCAMFDDECLFYSWVMGNDHAADPPQAWFLFGRRYRTGILMGQSSIVIRMR